MSLRGKAAIVGFAELPTQREYPGRDTLSLFAEVSRMAIRDAGLRKEDIDGLFTQETLSSLAVSEGLGIKPRYTLSITAHGATGATSVGTAAAVVNAGLADYVLCVFGMSRPPSSSRIEAQKRAAAGPPPSLGGEFESPFGPVIAANGGYGLMKQRHMFEYGTTQEQFAKCVVDERFNALENPNALWRGQPVTAEDVLNSRFTNDPIHLLEAVMPCSGANAAIVTTAERARSLPNPPAYILGYGGPASRHDSIWMDDEMTRTAASVTAPVALKMSGYSIKDMQFAQFYDCYTILVMASLEDAGICPKGEIGPFYESTDTTYKGAFPINTDGGQIGGGQPPTAGGFRHVVEATRQIMGRAGSRQLPRADVGIVNGNGGISSIQATLVLGSEAAL